MAATTGGIRAGRAFVLIEAIDKTSRVFGRVYTNFMKLGRDLSRLGQDIMMKSLSAMVPTALSLKVYKDFDDAMKKVEARSRGTGREMDTIRLQAKKLGRETAFTAAEIGNLQAILAQKGFSRSQIPKATVPIMTLARAAGEGFDAGEDAEAATRLVTGALKAWRMETDKAAEVADMMTAAVNGSSYTLQELITSLQYAGPVAAEFNLSLLDTLATLGMMRDLEIDPSIAGTAFRNMQLYMTSTKGQEEFNKVLQEATGNTISFVDEVGALRPLPDLLFAIGKATEGMGSAVKMNMLGELFGVRAVVPASALQHGIDQFAKLRSEIATANGLSDRTMVKMEAGIGGAWRRFQSAAEGVALAVGEALEPALIDLENSVSGIMNTFAAWTHNNAQAVIQILMMVGATFTLGVALTTLGIALKLIAVSLLPVIMSLRTLAAIMSVLKAVAISLWAVGEIHIATINLLRVATVAYSAAMVTARMTVMAFNAALAASEIIAIGATYAFMSLQSIWVLTSGIWGYIVALTVFGVLAILAAKGIYQLYRALRTTGDAMSGSASGLLSNFTTADYAGEYQRSADALRTTYAQAFSEIGADFNQWMNHMKTGGMELGNTLMSTWQGVSAALSLGDTQAAWDVGIEGMKLGWTQFTDMLYDTWNSFSLFFIETWEGTLTSFAEGWTSVQNTISKNLVGIMGGWSAEEDANKSEAERRAGLKRLMDKGLLTQEQLTGGHGANTLPDVSLEGIKGVQDRMDADKKAADQARREESGNRLRELANRRRTANEEREAKKREQQASLDEKLRAIQARAAEERKGAEDNLAKSFEDMAAMFNDRAAAIVHPGITAASGVAPEIKEGLTKGSSDAAKAAWENAMRLEDKKEDPAINQRDKIIKKLDDLIKLGNDNPLAIA